MGQQKHKCFIRTASYSLTGDPQLILAENQTRLVAFISANGHADVLIGSQICDFTNEGYNISATAPQEIQGLEAVYAASNTGGPTVISVMEESY